MVADKLIDSPVKDRALTPERAAAMQLGFDRAYAAARDAYHWARVELRIILAGMAGQVRGLQ